MASLISRLLRGVFSRFCTNGPLAALLNKLSPQCEALGRCLNHAALAACNDESFAITA
jgi:hypothetical protein